ncbi:MAG: hypothetical protein ACLROG_10620 [Coprococcus phoceensis]
MAVGNGVKNNLVHVYGIPDERINIIYNSVKIEQENYLNEDMLRKSKRGKNFIGNIGRLTKQKRY